MACQCGICRPPGTALREALRARFGSREKVLQALGLDQSLLEGERTMRTRDEDARSRDSMMRRGRDQEAMSEMVPDRRSRDMRRGRDQEYEDPEEGEGETLGELLERLDEGDKRMVRDALRHLVRDRGWSSSYDRRMSARDQPPPFIGMPEPGGSINWSEREAQDRRRGRFAADVAAASGRSYCDFFPAASRIGFALEQHKDAGEGALGAKCLLSLQHHIAHANRRADHLGGNNQDQGCDPGWANSRENVGSAGRQYDLFEDFEFRCGDRRF
jgi:hypothetical protein